MSSGSRVFPWVPRRVALLAGGAGSSGCFARARKRRRRVRRSSAPARFTLPSGYFRPHSRGGGPSGSLALAAFFPDFAPAGEASDVNAQDRSCRALSKSWSSSPSGRPIPASTRPTGRAALCALSRADDGATRAAWSPAPSRRAARSKARSFISSRRRGATFAARCRRPDQTQKTPNSCIYDFRSTISMSRLRFSAALLSEWEKLNAGARGLIEAARR